MGLSKQQRLAVAVAHVNFDDCASFWASLTTEQAAALERTAPKIAGPWVQRGASQWARLLVLALSNRPTTAAVVIDYSDICDWNLTGTVEPGTVGTAGDLEEAKRAADAALIASGWRLL